MSDGEDDDYFVPLTDQRVFGAGIRRKGIAFIPATNAESSVPQHVPPPRSTVADRYLSIVLRNPTSKDASTPGQESDGQRVETKQPALCTVCRLPVSMSPDEIAIDTHESSIAHQVCLEHSHPPSHLDRDHVGLRYLRGYGWDPDSRKGLGLNSEGIRVPIKGKEKNDTVGLREQEDQEDATLRQKKKPTIQKDPPMAKLDAGKVRQQQLEAKKHGEKLRATFYGPDLTQYLGPDG